MGLLQKILHLLRSPKTQRIVQEGILQHELKETSTEPSGIEGPKELPVYPGCTICEPELFISQTKTFECNSCHDWFCAEHFLSHPCNSDRRSHGYEFAQTGKGGMKFEKFSGTIGYTWKKE
jgi:hypothetical protein